MHVLYERDMCERELCGLWTKDMRWLKVKMDQFLSLNACVGILFFEDKDEKKTDASVITTTALFVAHNTA